jgi:hypothetical protein
MNAQRILKEARPLLWPWCAVALAGALPLVYPLAWTPLIYLMGFFVVPLLATLSLGNEFQHRTLSLLLSQPVGRMEIWGEKLSVTVVAVVSVVLVFSLALRATSFHPGRQELASAGAWIVAITASATFWTLIARSTVGGVALTLVVQFFIIMALNLAYWVYGAEYVSLGNTTFVLTVTFVFLCYAGVMLWLGGRTLTRFQAAGGLAGDDLLTAGPDVMPGAWAGWLCSRPTGATLNLFRKEFRLLRPVWLISLLAAVGWACLTLFGLLYERGFSRNFETAVISVLVVSTLIIAILAGSLSLGEERTSGTHAWHLTLPASAFLQWRIKLYVAVFAGIVGAGLPPMLLLGRSLLGASHNLGDVHLGMDWLLVVGLLTFAAFWCACAVNGTVPAVLWVLPVMIAIGLAGEFGNWAGRTLTNLVTSRFDLFATFKFTSAVVMRFQLSEILQFVAWGLYGYHYLSPMLVYILGPTILLAIFQSYRLFRTQVQNSTLSMVRKLLPLAAMASLCIFLPAALGTFVFRALNQSWTAEYETLRAIEKTQLSTAKMDAAHPLQLTMADLAKASPLSDLTRRWLGKSGVTIAPLKVPPSLDMKFWGAWGRARTVPFEDYLATIHFAVGTDCTNRFWWVGYPKRDKRLLVLICK